MKQKAKANNNTGKNPVLMTVAGLIGLGFLFLLIFFIIHAAKTSIYSNRTNANFTKASQEIDNTLSKTNITHSEANKAVCANSSSSWYNFDKYCLAGQDGVMVLNAEKRKTFEQNAGEMESKLTEYGWVGGGWLKSLAYNIARWPSTSTPSGTYTKSSDNGTCRFSFDTSYNAAADATTINTHVICEVGKVKP